jgi:hypothetical protein
VRPLTSDAAAIEAWLLDCEEKLMLIRNWRFVTILLVSLLLGLAFAHVLEWPAKMRYDAALYITLQKTLYVDGDHQTSAVF